MSKTKIAVVDDRKDARELVASVIKDAISDLGIKDEWDVLEISPLPDLSNYPSWVHRENIGVLLVDERLNEIANQKGKAANYNGSDLVLLLRKRFKDMPIYGVTSYPDDATLQNHFALFNEVIKRDIFAEKAKLYVERFLRTYQAFLETHEKELAELSVLSKKIALGKATRSEKLRADAIQKDLEIPVMTTDINTRQEWLDEFKKAIKELKDAQTEAATFLSKNKKTK